MKSIVKLVPKLKQILSKKSVGESGVAHDALIVALVVALVVGGIGYYVASRPKSNRAIAYSGSQWCVESNVFGQACLNAWNGGPFVKVYTHRGVANNYFNVQQAYNGNYFFKATGTSNPRWRGQCLGDAKNDPGIVKQTSLDLCPSTTNIGGGGWGTNFSPEDCGTNGIAFKNIHTGKYLVPVDFQNGDDFSLEGAHASTGCFTSFP